MDMLALRFVVCWTIIWLILFTPALVAFGITASLLSNLYGNQGLAIVTGLASAMIVMGLMAKGFVAFVNWQGDKEWKETHAP